MVSYSILYKFFTLVGVCVCVSLYRKAIILVEFLETYIYKIISSAIKNIFTSDCSSPTPASPDLPHLSIHPNPYPFLCISVSFNLRFIPYLLQFVYKMSPIKGHMWNARFPAIVHFRVPGSQEGTNFVNGMIHRWLHDLMVFREVVPNWRKWVTRVYFWRLSLSTLFCLLCFLVVIDQQLYPSCPRACDVPNLP